MKKFLIALCLLVGFTTVSFAQTARKKAPAAVKLEKVKPSTDARPVKKDGTPDKRFSVNKSTKEGPLKKDGTPDMRYKKNKKKKG